MHLPSQQFEYLLWNYFVLDRAYLLQFSKINLSFKALIVNRMRINISNNIQQQFLKVK